MKPRDVPPVCAVVPGFNLADLDYSGRRLQVRLSEQVYSFHPDDVVIVAGRPRQYLQVHRVFQFVGSLEDRYSRIIHLICARRFVSLFESLYDPFGRVSGITEQRRGLRADHHVFGLEMLKQYRDQSFRPGRRKAIKDIRYRAGIGLSISLARKQVEQYSPRALGPELPKPLRVGRHRSPVFTGQARGLRDVEESRLSELRDRDLDFGA